MLGEDDTCECLRHFLELEGCGNESLGKPRFQPEVSFAMNVSAMLSKCFCGLLRWGLKYLWQICCLV